MNISIQEQKEFIKNNVIKNFYKVNGKYLIYDEEKAKTYEKGGINHKSERKYYGDSRDYTHNYDYVLHFDENENEIIVSVFVENAMEFDEEGDYNYSTEIAFDMLSEFHYNILNDIKYKYPSFEKDKNVEMWGAGNRTAEMHIKLVEIENN
jgi:hypothetical protein